MNIFRSLFAKILVWFLATMAVTIIGIVSISIYDEPERPVMFGRMADQEFRDAQQAYETGGQPKLKQFLEHAAEGTFVRIALTDAHGRDLVTGEDDSRFLVNHRGGPPPQHSELMRLLRRRPPAFARPSRDGRYWWVVRPTHNRSSEWILSPQQLWLITVSGTLCWLLAFYLTSPLRRLQKTLEAFGHGDFSVRSGSNRRDEFGQLANTFDVMAARIESLVEAQRRLLMDISHELRSPLTRLGVAVEIARNQEDKEASLNRIQREADRLNVLVDQLLQVTRAESDPAHLHFEPVALDELITEIAADCRIEAEARNVTLAVTVAPATMPGDSELLRRAAENILRNAIRYAPPASAIEIEETSREGLALIRIRDYGPGVPESELPRLFDHFYRVETDRNRLSGGGVGLGLSIARRAVELHRGTVMAQNAGPGLLVEIRLPVSSVSESRSAA